MPALEAAQTLQLHRLGKVDSRAAEEDVSTVGSVQARERVSRRFMATSFTVIHNKIW